MSLPDRPASRPPFRLLFVCLAGLVALWLVIDFTDNFRDFREAHATFGQIIRHYAWRMPKMVLVALPVSSVGALLLSGSLQSWLKPSQARLR